MQIARWFTNSDSSESESIHTNLWSAEASSLLETEAFCKTLPMELRPVEENTVPSWLWRHAGSGENIASEFSLQQIFDRIAGSAAYQGWKKDLFTNEAAARSFYDEVRWLLSNGVLVIEPSAMAGLGVDWAYGLAPVPFAPVYAEAAHQLSLANASVDAILSGKDNGAQNRWRHFLDTKAGQKLTLRFSDTTREWGTDSAVPMPPLALDLNKVCREEGGVDCGALEQATRLAVILLELHYENLVTSPQASRSLALAPVNMASLLMRQGVAYDSEAGRATAAGVTALITATATTASARMAGQFGPCADFINDRAGALRFVANRRRAAYGDKNDYEHVSVLPVPLPLEACPDLALVAAVRHAWDEAFVDVQRFGLRHASLTQFATQAVFATLCGAVMPSLAPEASLIVEQRLEEDRYARVIHPAVPMALARLGYGQDEMKAIVRHVIGHNSLQASPVLNHEVLAARGFTKDVIAKIEAHIPEVNDVALVFTPWILGAKFCHEVLKAPTAKLEDFDFELLDFMGISAAEVVAANHYCYGFGTVETASELKHEHRALFACGEEIAPTARIKMSAAVQSFVTGDVDMALSLSTTTTAETRSELLLEAWKQGLKTISLYFDYEGTSVEPLIQQKASLAKPRRRIAVGKPAPQTALPVAEPVVVSPAQRKSKSTTKLVALRRKSAVVAHKTKG